MHDHPAVPADSAGQPWAGRQFEAQPAFAGDDGSMPVELGAALAAFRAGAGSQQSVVDALRGSRLLVPLIATLGESGTNERGVVVDKSAELAIVTVKGPDGREVLPAFTSVAAMQSWNPKARPVPSEAVRVALAAADERTDLVVLDPTSETEFVLRRPAVWAIAQTLPWIPSFDDAEVAREFTRSVAEEPMVIDLGLGSGDPDARLRGPELVVTLTLAPGLDQLRLDALLARLQESWGANELIAARVDSLAIKLVSTAG